MKIKALLIAGSTLLAAGCGGSPEPRTVPDLRGERLDVAERQLDGLGLEYERVGGGAFGIVVRSKWDVCEQRPKPGAKAAKVTLIVDRWCPPPPVRTYRMPDLVGERLSAAETRLTRRGIPFSVERVDGVAPPRASTVCDQEPPPGTQASRVTLYAARACEPAPVPPPVVPAVAGEELDDAEAALAAAGIEVVLDASGPGPVVEELWEVCRQTPAPGRRATSVVLHARDDCR
jgi:beta-lactam-binding protein with PASTA domain